MTLRQSFKTYFYSTNNFIRLFLNNDFGGLILRLVDTFSNIYFIFCQQVGEGTKVEGTLVFPGQVQGRACILSLGDDTTQICPGDILITQSTDVGWSPLYPLLSGVVTELGGLISHGNIRLS